MLLNLRVAQPVVPDLALSLRRGLNFCIAWTLYLPRAESTKSVMAKNEF